MVEAKGSLLLGRLRSALDEGLREAESEGKSPPASTFLASVGAFYQEVCDECVDGCPEHLKTQATIAISQLMMIQLETFRARYSRYIKEPS